MGNTKVFWSGLLIVGLVAALGACGLAAERSAEKNRGATAQQQQMPSSQTSPAGQATMLQKTCELIGKKVKNTQGEDLGAIHDLVLTPDYQQVSYAALSYGGVFGIGGKLHAIPWQALRIGSTGDITLSVSKDQLEPAPGFSNDHWPSQAETRWLSASSTSAGQAFSAGQASGRESQTRQPRESKGAMGATGQAAMANRDVQMRRVTHLTGTEVKNPENQDLGDIEDFVVNASDGRLAYAVLSFGGVAGIGEKYAVVPANAIRMQPQNHVAMLNATKQTLESVAFKSSEFPNLASAEYTQRIRQLFPATPAGAALGYVSPQPSQEAAGDKAWESDSQHSKGFNADTVKTIKGTVQSVGSFRPEGAAAGTSAGLRLRVKTTDGNLVTVCAGPSSYAEQKSFFVMPGDEISITGSETKIGSRSVVLASEIKKGDQTLQLRDQSGKPLWSIGRQDEQGQMQNQQGMRRDSGQKQSGATGQRPPGQSSDRTRQQ